MKKVLIIAPFTLLPDENGFNRFTYLADNLSKLGHDVTLITSQFRHVDKQHRKTIAGNQQYKIVLIDEPGYQTNVSLKRILSHTAFEYKLNKYFKGIDSNFDVIYAAYPLMGAAYLAGKYAKKIQKPFILDVQDVWPEAVKVAFSIPEAIIDIALKPLSIIANRTYKLADYALAVSNTYLDRVYSVNQNSKKYLSVYIGTDLEYFDQCSAANVQLKPQGEFWVTYIGTLSHSYDISTVIKAVALLKAQGYTSIRFKVLGTGPMVDRFMQTAALEQSPTDFLGMQSYPKMVQYLTQSDIAVNAIVARAHGSITNKIGDYLSAGLPILNSSLNGEFCKIVTEYNVGLNYQPGDLKRLAELIRLEFETECLRKEHGNNSRKLAEESFDRRITYKKIYDLIESIE